MVVCLLLVLFVLLLFRNVPESSDRRASVSDCLSVRIARSVSVSDRRWLSAAPLEIVAFVVVHRRKVELTVGVPFF